MLFTIVHGINYRICFHFNTVPPISTSFTVAREDDEGLKTSLVIASTYLKFTKSFEVII